MLNFYLGFAIFSFPDYFLFAMENTQADIEQWAWCQNWCCTKFSKEICWEKEEDTIIEMCIYGWLFPIAYCGVFGGREIVGALKIMRDP